MGVDAFMVWPDSRRWVHLGKMVDGWTDGKVRDMLRQAMEWRQDFLVVREDTRLVSKAPRHGDTVDFDSWEGWQEGPPWDHYPPDEPSTPGRDD